MARATAALDLQDVWKRLVRPAKPYPFNASWHATGLPRHAVIVAQDRPDIALGCPDLLCVPTNAAAQPDVPTEPRCPCRPYSRSTLLPGYRRNSCHACRAASMNVRTSRSSFCRGVRSTPLATSTPSGRASRMAR